MLISPSILSMNYTHSSQNQKNRVSIEIPKVEDLQDVETDVKVDKDDKDDKEDKDDEADKNEDKDDADKHEVADDADETEETSLKPPSSERYPINQILTSLSITQT